MTKLTRKTAEVNGRPPDYIGLVPVRHRYGTRQRFDLAMPGLPVHGMFADRMLEHRERMGDHVGHHHRPRCAERVNTSRVGSRGSDLGHRWTSTRRDSPYSADA